MYTFFPLTVPYFHIEKNAALLYFHTNKITVTDIVFSIIKKKQPLHTFLFVHFTNCTSISDKVNKAVWLLLKGFSLKAPLLCKSSQRFPFATGSSWSLQSPDKSPKERSRAHTRTLGCNGDQMNLLIGYWTSLNSLTLGSFWQRRYLTLQLTNLSPYQNYVYGYYLLFSRSLRLSQTAICFLHNVWSLLFSNSD